MLSALSDEGRSDSVNEHEVARYAYTTKLNNHNPTDREERKCNQFWYPSFLSLPLLKVHASTIGDIHYNYQTLLQLYT